MFLYSKNYYDNKMRIKLFGLLVVSSSYGVRIRRVERDVIAQLIGAGWTEAPDCAPDRV